MEAVYHPEKVNRIEHYSEDNFGGRWLTDKDYNGMNSDFKANEELQIRIFHDIGLNQSSFAYNGYHQTWKRVVRNMSANHYIKQVSESFSSVSMDKRIVGGMPTIQGTRIPVSLIISCIRDGMSIADICQDYGLKEENVKGSLDFVIEVLDRPFQED